MTEDWDTKKFGYPNLQCFANNFNLQSEDIINIYLYGSRVYGTFSELSDYDFIVVIKDTSNLTKIVHAEEEDHTESTKKQSSTENNLKEKNHNLNNNNNLNENNNNNLNENDENRKDNNLSENSLVKNDKKSPYENQIKGNDRQDATIVKESHYQLLVNQHKWNIIECVFLPQEFVILERKKISFSSGKVDMFQIRSQFSKVSGNSYQKTKKKLVVAKDYNPKIAKKSLFHSLRILMFAIQICKFGKIKDYSEANEIWKEIDQDPSLDWEHYHEKWKKKWNQLKTELRKESPKQ